MKAIIKSLLIIIIVGTFSMCALFDSEAPVITISNPIDGATVESLFAITGTASDNVSVTSVSIKIDTDEYSEVEGLETWREVKSLPTTGTHIITIKAEDFRGNISFADVTISVDESETITAEESD